MRTELTVARIDNRDRVDRQAADLSGARILARRLRHHTFIGPLVNVKPLSAVIYCAMMCGAAFLVWLGGSNRLPVKPFRAFVFLRDISYSFYLLHDDIGFVMMKWLLQWGVNAYVTLAPTFAAQTWRPAQPKPLAGD